MDVYLYGYGGMGKKLYNKLFEDYGEKFGKGDCVGCLLDLENGVVTFTKNGKVFGEAF